MHPHYIRTSSCSAQENLDFSSLLQLRLQIYLPPMFDELFSCGRPDICRILTLPWNLFLIRLYPRAVHVVQRTKRHTYMREWRQGGVYLQSLLKKSRGAFSTGSREITEKGRFLIRIPTTDLPQRSLGRGKYGSCTTRSSCTPAGCIICIVNLLGDHKCQQGLCQNY